MSPNNSFKPTAASRRGLIQALDGSGDLGVRIAARLLLVPLCAALAACGSHSDRAEIEARRGQAVTETATIAWPYLPESGFVTGRAATKDDVQAGNAVFVAERDGEIIGTPLTIQIPQYAFHLEEGTRTPVIAVQAERAGDIEMIGYLNFAAGTYGVGTRPEFELLGTTPPGAK